MQNASNARRVLGWGSGGSCGGRAARGWRAPGGAGAPRGLTTLPGGERRDARPPVKTLPFAAAPPADSRRAARLPNGRLARPAPRRLTTLPGGGRSVVLFVRLVRDEQAQRLR